MADADERGTDLINVYRKRKTWWAKLASKVFNEIRNNASRQYLLVDPGNYYGIFCIPNYHWIQWHHGPDPAVHWAPGDCTHNLLNWPVSVQGGCGSGIQTVVHCSHVRRLLNIRLKYVHLFMFCLVVQVIVQTGDLVLNSGNMKSYMYKRKVWKHLVYMLSHCMYSSTMYLKIL